MKLRPWSETGTRFDAVEKADAYRVERDGLVLYGKHLKGGRPAECSGITDANGTVWGVGTAVDSGPDSARYVRKK